MEEGGGRRRHRLRRVLRCVRGVEDVRHRCHRRCSRRILARSPVPDSRRPAGEVRGQIPVPPLRQGAGASRCGEPSPEGGVRPRRHVPLHPADREQRGLPLVHRSPGVSRRGHGPGAWNRGLRLDPYGERPCRHDEGGRLPQVVQDAEPGARGEPGAHGPSEGHRSRVCQKHPQVASGQDVIGARPHRARLRIPRAR